MLGRSQSQQRRAVVLPVGVGRLAVLLLPSAEMPAAAELLVEAHWLTGRKQNLQNLKGVQFKITCEQVQSEMLHFGPPPPPLGFLVTASW